MNVDRALRERGVDRDASADSVVGICLQDRRVERILHGALRDHAADRGGTVADDRICSTEYGVCFLVGAPAAEGSVGCPAERKVWQRRAGEPAVEAEIGEVG